MKKISNRARSKNEINAGSMADIAFLLLIFFLVTTTIIQDKGILVKLPFWEEDPPITNINSKNVFTILVNANDEVLIEKEISKISEIKSKLTHFILNPAGSKDLPKNPKSAIVSLQNDRNTTYAAYLSVYNEIKASYNQIRNERAMRLYGLAFRNCNVEQRKKIRTDIPMVISESEPTSYQEKI